MLSNRNKVCRHNQTGFCKYREQGTEDHVDEICNDKNECKDTFYKMRHPKKCKIFEIFGRCQFDNCAYLHVDNETKNKISALETEVNNLKLEVSSILTNVKEDNTKKIDTLRHDVK